MTRLLVLSDIHGAANLIPRLQEAAASCDIIAIAGDMTTFGGQQDAEPILSGLRRLNPNLVGVCGNCDLPEINDLMIKQGISTDGRTCTLEDLTFVGLGGSLPCPGHTPNESDDDHFGQRLRRALGDWQGPPEKLVVITHQPAYGTGLDQVGARHKGSPALRRFIEGTQPILAISGHIHEARGIDHLGETTLVNPGPFQAGYYAIAEIEGTKVEVELQELR